MLILVKTKDGFDKAINLSDVEFETSKDPTDESRVNMSIRTRNGEIVEASIPEEKYQNMLRVLEDNQKIMVL